MAVSRSMKIKLVPYNFSGYREDSLTTGERFEVNKSFLLLSSKPIPMASELNRTKGAKIYCEVTITNYTSSGNTIKYLPIYLGIHKNITQGVLSNSCAFMSCYFTKTEDLNTFYKDAERSSKVIITESVDNLNTRIPILNSVIGLGIDTTDPSKITLTMYSDGDMFYQFTPNFLKKGLDDIWYFAVYSKLNERLAGQVNFGRIPMQHLPEGYVSLHNYYYGTNNPTEVMPDSDEKVVQVFIPSQIETIEDTRYKVNPLTNRRDIYLEHNDPNMIHLNNMTFKMTSLESTPTNIDRSNITYINLPCLSNIPLYLEVSIQEGQIVEDMFGSDLYIGIPIEIGLSSSKSTLRTKSFRFCLYYPKKGNYTSYAIIDSVSSSYTFTPKTNIYPVQPNVIGLIFDRTNSKITIIVDNDVFAVVDIPSECNFSDNTKEAFIFFKSADAAYTGTLYGYVNVGDSLLTNDIGNEAITFYEYWNELPLRQYMQPYPSFDCRIRVGNEKEQAYKDIVSTLYVPRQATYQELDDGSNILYGDDGVCKDIISILRIPELSFQEFDNNSAVETLYDSTATYEDPSNTLYDISAEDQVSVSGGSDKGLYKDLLSTVWVPPQSNYIETNDEDGLTLFYENDLLSKEIESFLYIHHSDYDFEVSDDGLTIITPDGYYTNITTDLVSMLRVPIPTYQESNDGLYALYRDDGDRDAVYSDIISSLYIAHNYQESNNGLTVIYGNNDRMNVDILGVVHLLRSNYKGFGNGLNVLYNTYNTISDTEPHNNEPDVDLATLKAKITSDGKD